MTKVELFKLKLAREAVRSNVKQDRYCGIRFHSDKLVRELMDKGYSIARAVDRLAYLDYCSLHNKVPEDE